MNSDEHLPPAIDRLAVEEIRLALLAGNRWLSMKPTQRRFYEGGIEQLVRQSVAALRLAFDHFTDHGR